MLLTALLGGLRGLSICGHCPISLNDAARRFCIVGFRLREQFWISLRQARDKGEATGLPLIAPCRAAVRGQRD